MARSLIRWLLTTLCSMSLFACSQQDDAPALQVKVINTLERFAPFATVTGTDRVELFAARNEYEGFQFVVTAGTRSISNVRVEVSPLQNAQGDVLDQVEIFRQRYVQVSTPSPDSPYEPQLWPDILLPAANVHKGVSTAYRAFPRNLSAGENMPVWVDIRIPTGAKPGQYVGKVTISSDSTASVEVPVSLTVWDFALPQRSPLRTVFGTNDYRIAEIYNFERTENLPENNRLLRAYSDFLLDHYLSPETLWDASPEVDADGKADFDYEIPGLGTVNENMQHYVHNKNMSAYTYVFADSYPFADPQGKDFAKAQRFMQDYVHWAAQHIGAERCYTDPSFVDEPDTPEAYAHARSWGEFFDKVKLPDGKKIRFQVSEPPLNENPKLGDLHGAVDVWIPKFYDLWRDVDNLQSNVAGQRLQQGEEMWAYTALVLEFEPYKRLNPQADQLKGNYPPVWQLDFPAINYRIPTWFFHRYGVSGLGYWDTIAWFAGADVWQDAASFEINDGERYIFNGDGLLVYPGRREDIGFDGPVASLRLKWIRDSIEDYMYIHMLYELGEDAFVQQQLQRIARHFGDWDNDPVLLMQVRQALGERLHARQGGR